MKRKTFLFVILFVVAQLTTAQLAMGSWKIHNAYGMVSKVENGNDKVYALSYGALLSVDKEDGQIEYYNKLTGLSSSNIVDIKYDKQYGRLVIVYSDGNIDFLYDNGNVVNTIDLYTSQTNQNKKANMILLQDKTMYMAMNFGILEFDLQRRVLKETYYIGDDAASVNVNYLAASRDSLYALSADSIYVAAQDKNKLDYHNWKSESLPGKGVVMGLQSVNDTIYLLRGGKLFKRQADQWQAFMPDSSYSTICNVSNQLSVVADDGLYVVTSDSTAERFGDYRGIVDAVFDDFHKTYWYALSDAGVGCRSLLTNDFEQFIPNGPIVNTPYRMRITGDRLFVVPGGYWATKDNKPATAMIYDIKSDMWTNYNAGYFLEKLGVNTTDYSDIIGDPNDPSHFFIAAFCIGILEFKDNEFFKIYNVANSPLINADGLNPNVYTWVDGFTFDKYDNLFFFNVDGGICILSKIGDMVLIHNTEMNIPHRSRVKNLLVSNMNENIKIFVNNTNAFEGTGVGAYNDNGTLTDESDDKLVFWHTFVDQNNNVIEAAGIYSIDQDSNGELWVGTDAGIFIIPDVEQMFTSNACRRVIINRTDDSGLADYLLAEERINAIAVDGANRKWIGTQSSGLYLVSADGTETIEHFTTDNSPLMDNSILSIAIHPKSGEVFVGTGLGIVSYQSDAAEPEPEMPNENLYVYPNPVREGFEGKITITGLMENTIVKITDSAGMLVAETTSLGSLATWDGKDMNGNKVRTGVYFAQCVSADGHQYALEKILIIH